MKIFTSCIRTIAFLFLTSMSPQVIEVNPSISYQEVVFGGDVKLTIKNYADGNTSLVSDKLFNQMNLKILRVPIFALQPISDPIYDDIVEVIKSAKAVKPNVKIFASIANGDGYGQHHHGTKKFPSSWKCCSDNVYRLNLTAYASYLDSFMQKMRDAGITIDYLGPWNEDPADDSDHKKVFDQMNHLGATQKVGLERWALTTSVSDVDDVEDRTDIIGSHFYDDGVLGESNWDATWASLVNSSEDPVWYTESTRYSINDNIDRLIAGLDNIFPAMRSGVEAVIFYQACNRIVYANGSTPAIKYSGFKNLVNNASGKVMDSSSDDSAIKVVSFGDGTTLNVHILNTGTSSKMVSVRLTNGYSVSGAVTRTIWDASNTEKSNSYTLNGDSMWNVACPANGYTHLNITLNQVAASITTSKKQYIHQSFENKASKQLSVTQNEATGAINFSLPKIEGVESLTVNIYSINGSRVLSKKLKHQSEISIAKNLAAGVYLVNVTYGNSTYNGKVSIVVKTSEPESK